MVKKRAKACAKKFQATHRTEQSRRTKFRDQIRLVEKSSGLKRKSEKLERPQSQQMHAVHSYTDYTTIFRAH